MTLQEYFALPDTPMENSPVGLWMRLALRDTPGMSFEALEATRAEARQNPFRGTETDLQRQLSMTPEQRAALVECLTKVRQAKVAQPVS